MIQEKKEDNKLQQELEQLKVKAEEYLNGWKRAKADYLNFKKDSEKRFEEIIQFANAALLAELLPIFDHLKLAVRHIPPDQKEIDWVQGFVHIKSQFGEFFKKLGIEEIKTVGEKFDPEFHEAVVSKEHEGIASGIIFEEVKAGYTLHGKVINPAKVKVAE